MRLDIVGRNLEITPAIRAHAEDKMSKLPRYSDLVQSCTITLTRDAHHKHGEFQGELLVDVEKHEDFVAHAHGDDVYLLVDSLVQKASRQLTEFKERLKNGKR